MSLGTIIGHTTQALPQLYIRNETNNTANKDLKINEYEGSWFASAFWVCGIICCPLGGWLGGYFGRRKIILLMSPLLFIAWAVLGSAQNIALLFLGRMLSAIALSIQLHVPGKASFINCFFSRH